jgi:hypothetical protein
MNCLISQQAPATRASFPAMHELAPFPTEASGEHKRYQFDEAKVRRYRKKGRGAGSGVAYVPWLKINDVASQGRSPNIGHRNQRAPGPQGLHADTVAQM